MILALFGAVSGLLYAGLPSAEVVHLKDGSAIRGKLVRISNDTLYVRTSFGSDLGLFLGTLRRIDFDGEPGVAASVEPPQTGGQGGVLEVVFEEFTLTSRIAVHRDRDRAGHEAANAIAQNLLVDGAVVHSYVDSVTDKVIREGSETILRNDFRPQGMKVPLTAGAHACSIVLANEYSGEYEGDFVSGKKLKKSLRIESVVIRPGEKTVLKVGMKKRKMGLTGSDLVVVP